MPALVTCGKKWTVGSDDFVMPALIAIVVRLVCLGFIVGVVIYLFIGPSGCENYPNDTVHPFLYGSLLAFIMLEFFVIINEVIIFSRSVRGTITNPGKRTYLAFWLFIRIFSYFAEFGLNVACLAAIFGPAANSLQCPEYHDGPLVFAKVVILVMILVLLIYAVGFSIYLDPLGVCCAPHKIKDMTDISQLGNEGVDSLDAEDKHELKKQGIGRFHRNHIGAGRIVRKVRNLLCCVNASRHRSRSNALQEMATALYTVFSNDISLVTTDLVAGLVLVSRDQKKKATQCKMCVEKREYCPCQSDEFRKLTFAHMPKDDVPDGYVRQPPRRFDFDDLDDRLLFEDIVHYMKFAMSIYGWPLHIYNDLCCGVCQLSAVTWCSMNYSCCNPRHGPDKDFVNDGCCACGVGTIRARTKLQEKCIRYASYNNDVYMAPYTICFDNDRQTLILAVRGTLSIKDVLTDLSVSMTELKEDEMISGVQGKQYVHTGMYNTAKEILKDLNKTKILEELLAPSSEFWNYRLVLCGHSLGAGAASVLAILLKSKYPDLVCFAYSTPGCIFSFPLALYTRKFITSVVLGNDVIPRTTFRSLLFMKRQVRFLLKECKKPKAQVIFQPRFVDRYMPESMTTCCCGPHKDPDFCMEDIKSEIKPKYRIGGKLRHMDSFPIFSQKVSSAKKFGKRWRKKAQDKNVLHHFVDQIESGEKIASFPPGNMVHIEIKKKTNNWCLSFCIPNDLWVHHVSSEDMCVMSMDRGMVDDHLPNAVMSALDQCLDEYVVKQGYNPGDKNSPTWSKRRERMRRLTDKRKSMVDGGNDVDIIVEDQPVSTTSHNGADQSEQNTLNSTNGINGKHTFLTAVEVMVDGLQLEKLKEAQDEEHSDDNAETEM